MTSKNELYIQMKKNVQKTNAMLQQLRGQLDTQGWAATRLIDKLSADIVNAVTDKGYVKYNKNLSVGQMNAIIKATNQFLASKTSTVAGVKENISNVKEGITGSLDVTAEQANRIYDFFATDKYNMSDEVKYEALKIAVEVNNKGGDSESYINRVKQYIEYGNDENMKNELLSIYDLLENGNIDFRKINFDKMRY